MHAQKHKFRNISFRITTLISQYKLHIFSIVIIVSLTLSYVFTVIIVISDCLLFTVPTFWVFWKSSRHFGHRRCLRIWIFSRLCTTETEECRGRNQCCFIQFLGLGRLSFDWPCDQQSYLFLDGISDLVDKKHINRASFLEMTEIRRYGCIVLRLIFLFDGSDSPCAVIVQIAFSSKWKDLCCFVFLLSFCLAWGYMLCKGIILMSSEALDMWWFKLVGCVVAKYTTILTCWFMIFIFTHQTPIRLPRFTVDSWWLSLLTKPILKRVMLLYTNYTQKKVKKKTT